MKLPLSAAMLGVTVLLAACAESMAAAPTSGGGPDHSDGSDGPDAAPDSAARGGPTDGGGAAQPCTAESPLTVHFYDAGQALSALVTLPNHRHILIDAGESPTRPCAGCKSWHQRVVDGINRDLGAYGLDALWITHQHSDHVGGAADVLTSFGTAMYVDNGRDLDKTAGVESARAMATTTNAAIRVVDPDHPASPLTGSAGVTFTPIVPTTWPVSCAGDPNACSIGLRVDYCQSSILFTGDATVAEEAVWDITGEVTLLQVAHHGSDTSTGQSFLAKAKPKYAVISAAKPDEGTNAQYCHPSASVVTSLTQTLGGAGGATMRAFDSSGTVCTSGATAGWQDVPASDRLWLTARDGDVLLKTIGDGVFTKE